MKLTVYTDDSLSEVAREVTTEGIKIPYRTSIEIIKSLDGMDIDNDSELLNLLISNVDALDKIIKATFKVTEDELSCIDTAEIISVGKELYEWTIDKIKNMKGTDSKNVEPTV